MCNDDEKRGQLPLSNVSLIACRIVAMLNAGLNLWEHTEKNTLSTNPRQSQLDLIESDRMSRGRESVVVDSPETAGSSHLF